MKNIKLLLFFVLSCLIFIGCAKNDFGVLSKADKVQSDYYMNFVNTFCDGDVSNIDPNHTWGFGESTKTITRSILKPDMPAWYNVYEIPAEITDAERNEVYNEFNKVVNNPENHNKLPNYTSFIVQHVYTGHSNMDQLQINGQHANDFNATNGKKVLYENEQIGDFSYWNSHDGARYNDWICLHIKGNYYIGFDYKQLRNGLLEPDGVYTDWIIKIVPANMKYDYRVIAEDLTVNGNGDFDFNDVVFDVKFVNNKTYILLQAAGGTLPLTVAGYEVHEAFGVDVNTMVNTNNGTINKEPVSIVVENSYNYDVKKIPILVNYGTDWVELNIIKDKVPSKICVKSTFKWCDERQDIEDKYPDFIKYVKNENTHWY